MKFSILILDQQIYFNSSSILFLNSNETMVLFGLERRKMF
jgi:hypothetical protein